MKLSAPKQITYLISVIIAIVAVVGKYFVVNQFFAANAFIFLIVAFVILALANFVKGL
ncbi:hypothetical protein L0Z72_04980 [candidate division KSB1 bacterium]|jgi:hypothetical protein|nr:hypothetical protein [candidate division KSB1 bacterium]